jgi:hypothetical protein
MERLHRATSSERSRAEGPCALIDRHYGNLHHPKIWICKSVDLDLSAECLWASYSASDSIAVGSFDVAFMLAGMSLECLFKARVLCDYEWPFDKNNIEEIVQYGHNLVSLAQKTKIPMDVYDESTLDELGHYIRWLGRYPAPKASDHYRKHRAGPGARWGDYVALRNKFAGPIKAAVNDYAKTTHPPRS